MSCKICPSCGAAYTDPPALSRKNPRIMICPECGAKEALQAAGMMEMFGETIDIYRKARSNYEKACMGR